MNKIDIDIYNMDGPNGSHIISDFLDIEISIIKYEYSAKFPKSIIHKIKAKKIKKQLEEKIKLLKYLTLTKYDLYMYIMLIYKKYKEDNEGKVYKKYKNGSSFTIFHRAGHLEAIIALDNYFNESIRDNRLRILFSFDYEESTEFELRIYPTELTPGCILSLNKLKTLKKPYDKMIKDLNDVLIENIIEFLLSFMNN